MNLGGPATQAAVKPFLTRLFSDREIISLPFQEYSSRLIARRRSGIVEDDIEKIEEVRRLSDGLRPKEHFSSLSWIVFTCNCSSQVLCLFRYADPLTADCVAAIKADALLRLVLSQYPQYSCTTTGSDLNELHRELKRQQVESALGGPSSTAGPLILPSSPQL